ncbi:unnamed protein product [Closterium sp. NIES-65]|nr:unnamed protein product [Closterium sp. NIES-65]
MNQPRRKSAFRIEPFRHKVEMDPRYAEKTWGILEDAIHQIYSHNASGLSFEELYRNAYNMVLHKYGDRLYAGLVSTMTAHLKGVAAAIEAAHGPLFLNELDARAGEHHDMTAHRKGVAAAIEVEAAHGPLFLNELDASLNHDGAPQGRGGGHRGGARPAVPQRAGCQVGFYRGGTTKTTGRHDHDKWHDYGQSLQGGILMWHEYGKSLQMIQDILMWHEYGKSLQMIRDILMWHDYGKSLQMIRDILMYMDRTYVTNHNKTPVHDLGLALWRDHIVRAPAIRPRLLSTLLSLIHQERSGEVINRALMRSISSMFADLGPAVYSEDLERPFLEASAAFYRGEAQRYLGTCDCADYLKVAERRLEEEGERVAQYLDARTEGKVTGVVEREMVGNHLRLLVDMENSGLVPMLVNDKYEDIARMYRLLKRVPAGLQTMREDIARMYRLLKRVPAGLQTMREVMSGHLRETGRQLVTDPDRETGRQLVTDPDRYGGGRSGVGCKCVCTDDAGGDVGAPEGDGQAAGHGPGQCKDKYDHIIAAPFRRSLLHSSPLLPLHSFRCKDPGEFVQRLLEENDKCKDPVEFVQRLLEEKDKYDRIISASFASDKAFHTTCKDPVEFVQRLLEEKNKYDRIISASFASDKAFHTALSTAFECKDPVEFVQRLLEEKDKYDRIISASFASDKAFHTALSTAFEFFLNLNARAAEYISLFIDDKLRKGLKGASEEEAEAVLDKVMMLFRFLQEKDVFEKYYKQHLAKRLLSGKTVSDDAERSFIVKLKTECGYQFTSKLEGMFLDMKTSQDTMHAFHCALQAEAAAAAVATGGGVGVVEERGGGEGEVEDPASGVAAAAAAAAATGLREEGGDEGGEEEGEGSARGGAAVAALRTEPDLALTGPSGTAAGSGAGSSSSASAAAGGAAAGGLFQGPTLSVQVLTTGSWPTQAGARCNLPGEILPICEKFTRHYLTTHTGRRLTWQMNMGHADVKATFESRKYELSVSTYQVGWARVNVPGGWGPCQRTRWVGPVSTYQVGGARVNVPGGLGPCQRTRWVGPVSTYQMCTLMLFNTHGSLTYRDIEAATDIPSADLRRNLQSLSLMCILMLFNTHDSLTYRDIEAATDIPSADLRRNLQSLSLVRGKNVLRKEPVGREVGDDDTFHFNHKFTSKFFKNVLRKEPVGKEVGDDDTLHFNHKFTSKFFKEVGDDDTFHFNHKFTSKFFKVKIGTISAQKETEPEKAETRQKVEEDRKPQIEAAIVRIMKSRRMLDHNNLVSEVTKQLQARFLLNPAVIKKRIESLIERAEVTKQLQARFLPNPAVIKKRIESLIEREFLERDRNDRKLYRYLA